MISPHQGPIWCVNSDMRFFSPSMPKGLLASPHDYEETPARHGGGSQVQFRPPNQSELDLFFL